MAVRSKEHEFPSSKKNFSFLVRRARLLMGQTQSEFAEHFDVETSTVSRWERGLVKPLPKALAAINAIAFKTAPFILASPVIKFLANVHDLAKPLVISKGAAEFLEAVGYTLEDFAEDLPPKWPHRDKTLYPISITSCLKEIERDPRWINGQLAYAEFRAYGTVMNAWTRGLVARLPDKDDVALVEVVPDRNSQSEGRLIRPVPFHFR